ncbi:hypothetical protein L1987_78401 [Smallanthus sonchifolius]|uniref:Uncharacterized protein n=1 Tax=Smallanthus sonchifolius TaxID=185202 RepID=A0ACB8ZCJ4_9ASTR|nr:hypothetical protein L1987_78401 [Smallanthus sonchifolius]
MFSKRFLILFVVLLITSEITPSHESEVEGAKYNHNVREYHKDEHAPVVTYSTRSINSIGHYGLPPGVKCC